MGSRYIKHLDKKSNMLFHSLTSQASRNCNDILDGIIVCKIKNIKVKPQQTSRNCNESHSGLLMQDVCFTL
jgi:hypothetical protein